MSTIAAGWIDRQDSRESETPAVKPPREIEFTRALDHYIRRYRNQNRRQLTSAAGEEEPREPAGTSD
jgi:hypothetical protein